jgi:hypothetical protein
MAINPKQLAGSTARTAPSIVIKATNPAGQMISIGAIKKIDRRITRTNTRRRELDSNVPGISVELIPGAVTDFSITIDRAMLNKSNMLEAFGISGVEDLIYQNIPIDIEEHRFNPDGSEQIITYKGCYFNSNPESVDIDGNWLIIQSATLDVTTALVQNAS